MKRGIFFIKLKLILFFRKLCLNKIIKAVPFFNSNDMPFEKELIDYVWYFISITYISILKFFQYKYDKKKL